jgi:hypothetical protein
MRPEGEVGVASDGLPISPELILVSSPEEQQRARELLPPAPADEWDRLLTRIRAAAEEAEQISPPRSRKPRRALVLASLVLVAVAVPIGMAGARDNVGVGGPRSTKVHRVTSPAAHPATALAPTAPAKAPSVKRPAVKALRPAGRPSTTGKSRPKTKAGSGAAKAKAQPKLPKPATPRVSGFVPSRVWGWVAQPGSKSYLFRLYRNGRQVYTARTKQAQLVLPSSFHFARGKYRWSVVAVTGSAKRGLKPVVESTFVLSGPAAAKANG